ANDAFHDVGCLVDVQTGPDVLETVLLHGDVGDLCRLGHALSFGGRCQSWFARKSSARRSSAIWAPCRSSRRYITSVRSDRFTVQIGGTSIKSVANEAWR